MMTVLETQRLILRLASLGDDGFVLRLLNEASFLRFIGDRGVRSLDDARRYITERFLGSYEQHGFGMWVVERKDPPGPIGICGLVKRDALPDPDIGFAFLPEFWSRGYGSEAALAVKHHAFDSLALPRLLAVTNPENAASIRIVERLGLELVRLIELSEGQPAVRLYALAASRSSE